MDMEVKQSKQENFFHYKILIVVSAFYMVAVVSSDLFTYKIFKVGSIEGSASLIVFPLIYLLSNLVTEIYGKSMATFLLLCALTCEFFFDVVLSQVIYLPSPQGFAEQMAFKQILGSLPDVYWGALVALTVSAMVNINLMAWWKNNVDGKFYLFRSFFSTLVGVLLFTVIGYFIWFWGIKSVSQILELIFVSIISKLVIISVMIWPIAQIVRWVKNKEDAFIGQDEAERRAASAC